MDWSQPRFVEPSWLVLSAAAPALLAWLHHYAARARARQAASLVAPHLQREMFRSLSPWRRQVKHLLLLGAVALCGLALARPQWGRSTETVRSVGEDLMILLDCSRSMLAEDIHPNRLERAKLGIVGLLQTGFDGRVGLVAFAGQAFLQCPLTADHDAFRESVMAVDSRSIATEGTNLGRALEEAALAMEPGARRRTMLLVTDGEDLEGSGVRVAQGLAQQGVMVHAVGVGLPHGAQIRIVDELGKPGFLRDGRGEIVRSRLDEATLELLAKVTGGSYRRLGSAGEGMTDLRAWLHDSPPMTGEAAVGLGVERFYVPLTLAILLLAGEPLLGTRRRESGIARAHSP